MKKPDMSFTIVNHEGIELECDTLALIGPEEGEEFFEPYIIYTDYSLDDNNLFNIYVAQITGEGEHFELKPVENYGDIEAIKKELDSIFDEENFNII